MEILFIYDNISLIFFRNKNFHTKFVEKIKTHFFCSPTFVFFFNRAVSRTM